MQIKIGDIIVIDAHNDHGILQSVKNDYAYIYWHDGIVRSIAVTTLIELLRMKRWTHYAI